MSGAGLLLQASVLSFATIAPLNVPPLLLLGSEAVTASVLVLSVAQLLSVRLLWGKNGIICTQLMVSNTQPIFISVGGATAIIDSSICSTNTASCAAAAPAAGRPRLCDAPFGNSSR